MTSVFCSKTLILAPECRKCILRGPDFKIFLGEHAPRPSKKLAPSELASRALAKVFSSFTYFKNPVFSPTPCLLYTLILSCTYQGHPTSIFRKYLFGRRFEIQNFLNICCKISCLAASSRIFRTSEKWYNCPFLTDFFPYKVTQNFREPFFWLKFLKR